MSNPTCPFCGAAVKPGWDGSIYWFDCGTMNNANDQTDRHDQTAICAKSERDRMAKELADAKERIGNSVPPNLMLAIAKHVKLHLLGKT